MHSTESQQWSVPHVDMWHVTQCYMVSMFYSELWLVTILQLIQTNFPGSSRLNFLQLASVYLCKSPVYIGQLDPSSGGGLTVWQEIEQMAGERWSFAGPGTLLRFITLYIITLTTAWPELDIIYKGTGCHYTTNTLKHHLIILHLHSFPQKIFRKPFLSFCHACS